MGWNGLERNKLDYILTDLLPVEVSELFSFTQFYLFLSKKKNKKTLDEVVKCIHEIRAKSEIKLFENGWSTKPLKFKIIKNKDSFREMSIIQPLSALNLFLFIECYQKDILNYFEKHNRYSIRYHKKCTDLYYKSRQGPVYQYFHRDSITTGRNVIQQAGNYFKIGPYESINSLTDSKLWRMCNFKYKFYAKIDYKACFDSIYTHAFTWIIERNVIDAKQAKNSHLFITIDRILQNINGRSSNGILVGPEFSRMIAEILLQHIDYTIYNNLDEKQIYDVDYVIFRYVDDLFIFSSNLQVIDSIITQYRNVAEKYLLHLNDLKFIKGDTPWLPKDWLEKTRQLSDTIQNFFSNKKKSEYESLPIEERFIVKNNFISIDRLKDEIAGVLKKHPEDTRTIVSFLLSTLLNNFCKKKDGFTLFKLNHHKKAFLLIDLCLYIYAYFPTFDQTRKIISIITYINTELNIKNNSSYLQRLSNLLNQYSFIFNKGAIFDFCDWFPFFNEYKIHLNAGTERILIKYTEKYDNPIIWGNLLIYSIYNKNFFNEILSQIEQIVELKIEKISSDQPMMSDEFWYALIFYNCPYINSTLINKINSIFKDIQNQLKSEGKANSKSKSEKHTPSGQMTLLLMDFLNNKTKEGFFNWNINNFSNQLSYRTYQRTLFKRFKRKNYLFTSLD